MLGHQEYKKPGELLLCGPHQIHSMEDAGGDVPLRTLHVYTKSIETMTVYNKEGTFIVKGSAGAWLPPDDPNDVIANYHHHLHSNHLPFRS